MSWQDNFDKQFKPSSIWEDAENNPHSTVHSIKAFIADLVEKERKEAVREVMLEALQLMKKPPHNVAGALEEVKKKRGL